MRAPSFWWTHPGLPAAFLSPLAAIYGLAARARLSQRGKKAEVPVICVGNLVAGGAAGLAWLTICLAFWRPGVQR